MKVALVHDWLTGMRGGERVLDAICEIYPRADLYTLLYVPGSVSPNILARNIYKSILQKIPSIEKRYRGFLPLMPFAIERFNLDSYDLIISSSHCVAKGIKKGKNSIHISYIFTPMRYMWDMYDEYFSRSKIHVRLGMNLFRKHMQKWDILSSKEDRVDKFITLSNFVKERINRVYSRDSDVIYPFVELSRFEKPPTSEGNFYLILSSLSPYKNIDLAIRVFNKLKLYLRIIGTGDIDETNRLKKMAGPTIEFLGKLKDRAVVEFLYKCKALIFPGIEDFGITPLEAMVCGKPVIALEKGGVTETVTNETGIFFKEPKEDFLIEAILKLEEGKNKFDPNICRKRGELFSRERFINEFQNNVNDFINN